MGLRGRDTLVLRLRIVVVFTLVGDVAWSSVTTGAGSAVTAGSSVTHKTQHDKDETDNVEDPRLMLT
jgi:hypothetical protein